MAVSRHKLDFLAANRPQEHSSARRAFCSRVSRTSAAGARGTIAAMRRRLLPMLVAAAATFSAAHALPSQARQRRLMAVTIDDLPFGPGNPDPAAVASATERMLRALRDHRVPAMGFVNEATRARGHARRAPRALLHRWSLALGKPMRLKDEPEVPRWIVDAVRGG